ncbi:MAG: hypothetical protein PWQ67_286 [Clostridia bacterium]|nr:hypothetical protein [Clostridia bacterium]MDN5321832.1 hypothetical protein [Clostridia bacterium]
MDFSRVTEKTKEPYFTVKHKLLCVPRADYETILKSYLDPYTEEGVQEFVSKYLAAKNDPGIVGLVGLERKEEQVLIDAAVRYNTEEGT